MAAGLLSRHRNSSGTLGPGSVFGQIKRQEFVMRGILLWLIGLPIPIIILLYLFDVL